MDIREKIEMWKPQLLEDLAALVARAFGDGSGLCRATGTFWNRGAEGI